MFLVNKLLVVHSAVNVIIIILLIELRYITRNAVIKLQIRIYEIVEKIFKLLLSHSKIIIIVIIKWNHKYW